MYSQSYVIQNYTKCVIVTRMFTWVTIHQKYPRKSLSLVIFEGFSIQRKVITESYRRATRNNFNSIKKTSTLKLKNLHNSEWVKRISVTVTFIWITFPIFGKVCWRRNMVRYHLLIHIVL